MNICAYGNLFAVHRNYINFLGNIYLNNIFSSQVIFIIEKRSMKKTNFIYMNDYVLKHINKVIRNSKNV